MRRRFSSASGRFPPFQVAFLRFLLQFDAKVVLCQPFVEYFCLKISCLHSLRCWMVSSRQSIVRGQTLANKRMCCQGNCSICSKNLYNRQHRDLERKRHIMLGLVGSMAGIFLMAALYEGLKVFREFLQQRDIANQIARTTASQVQFAEFYNSSKCKINRLFFR